MNRAARRIILITAGDSVRVLTMPRCIEILPSILSADMAFLAEQVDEVREGGARVVHVDVMDGHFVPSITIGPAVLRSLRHATDLMLDVHLMIENPDSYIPEFVASGADVVTVHQEACRHLDRTLDLIRTAGSDAGVAMNPATPVEMLWPVLDMLDMVLVMSVNPGFGGQQFIPYTLEKVYELVRQRQARNLHFRIEVDGGITPGNVGDAVRAGADWIVAGSNVFESRDPCRQIERMQQLVQEAALSRL